LVFFAVITITANSQLIVGVADKYILVTNVLVGDGIVTKNIDFIGYNRSAGFFENGSATILKMDKGVILSTGLAVGAKGPNDAGDKTTSELGSNSPGSDLLDTYASNKTYNAAVLQFDFIPQTDEIVFNYIFASEEYIEYVDKGVSDIFGFFISGPGIVGEQNVALVPGTALPVSIDNLNNKKNSAFFKLNTFNEKTLQADGFTTRLTANLKLIPCQTYTIKLAIADVGDNKLDSYVFLESGSFKHKTLIGRDTFICMEGFDIELDAGNPSRRVLWSTGDTSHKIKVSTFGEYWVEIFTDCGSFKDYKKILPGVQPISLGKDTLYCGDSFSRRIEVLNRKFENYLWSDGSTNEFLIAKKPGQYWLEITNDGCKKRDTVNIELEALPIVNLGTDTIICGKVNIVLGSKEIALKYLWSTGDTDSRILVTKPDKYWLKVSGKTCKNQDTIIIQIRNKLTIELGPPIELCANDTFRLRTRINDTLNYSTVWNTGETSSAIFLTMTGTYSVVIRDKLCNFVVSDSIKVKLYNGEGNIYVPNAFTPNGDGLNEIFKPISDVSSYNYYRFLVFNRWGEKLFDTDDSNSGWDGTFGGKICLHDVYMWTLNVKSNCSNGENNFNKGIVHLIR